MPIGTKGYIYLIRGSPGGAANENLTMENDMVQEGKKAPAFKLKDQEGSQVASGDFKGKKAILFFYPKANTGG